MNLNQADALRPGNVPSNCHAASLISTDSLLKLVKLNEANDSQLTAVTNLYCQIWQEPPWNETDWVFDKVFDFLQNIKNQLGGIAYAAFGGDKVFGFTAGWEVNQKFLASKKVQHFFNPQHQVFYIAELGCDQVCRGQGIGKLLSQKLLYEANRLDYHHLLLRTHIEAHPARRLYSQLGFTETEIRDGQFNDRSYWIMQTT